MIEQADVMNVLLGGCPTFEKDWDEFVHDYGNDLLYPAVGIFARHLLRLFQSDDAVSLAAAGSAIERLIVEGSPYVQELAVVGVLEGIQNVWSNNKVDPENFFPYLGCESGKAWKELNRAWSGQS